MKQNLSPARLAGRYKIAIVTVVAVFCCGCATIPRDRNPPKADEPAAKTVGRMNINTATAVELESLPGIGKVLAERIVEHRIRYGSFRRVEHLMMVRGISEKKFLELQPSITAE